MLGVTDAMKNTKPGIKESGRRYYFVLNIQESRANQVVFEQIPKERETRSQCDVRIVCLEEGAATAKDLKKMLVPHVQMQTRKPIGAEG